MGEAGGLAEEQERALGLLSRVPGAKTDIVKYRYPPIEPPEPGPVGFPVAGLRDLAAMKVATIASRGLRRDFWDLRAIVRARLPLGECCGAYVQRFGLEHSELYHVMKALTYFVDAEADDMYPAGLTPAAWAEIKAFFAAEVPKLLLGP